MLVNKMGKLGCETNKKFLLDISKGRFYSKDEIVRIYKTKDKLHFKNIII